MHLRIYGGVLYVSNVSSGFDYDVRGTLALSKSARYLRVTNEGKLKLKKEPHIGFLLTRQLDAPYKGDLSYLGQNEFQLCEDFSLRFNSSCKDPVAVKITFRDRFHLVCRQALEVRMAQLDMCDY